MGKLEIAMWIIGKLYSRADCGIYNTRNIVGDEMLTIYNSRGLQIDLCPHYSYFEVFGLSEEEFASLKSFYFWLGEQNG